MLEIVALAPIQKWIFFYEHTTRFQFRPLQDAFKVILSLNTRKKYAYTSSSRSITITLLQIIDAFAILYSLYTAACLLHKTNSAVIKHSSRYHNRLERYISQSTLLIFHIAINHFNTDPQKFTHSYVAGKCHARKSTQFRSNPLQQTFLQQYCYFCTTVIGVWIKLRYGKCPSTINRVL